MNGNTSTAVGRAEGTSAGARLVDDLLRQRLRVGDPKNGAEIAAALLKLYPDEATRLSDQERGLFAYEPAERSATAAEVQGTGEVALREACARLEADLEAVCTMQAARDWVPELGAWKSSLLDEAGRMGDAASLAVDPAQRDRVLLSLRRFGAFARVARLISISDPEIHAPFRRVAVSLDEVGCAARVLLGEALWEAGLAKRGFLLQVPLGDARQRRDAVVEALRKLTSGTAASDTDAFGRAPFWYGDLLRRIDDVPAPELRVYLREDTLAAALDRLLGTAARQDPQALRGLAATAPVELLELERLAQLCPESDSNGTAATTVPSSALLDFFESLQLFLDAFLTERNRVGARFADLAVPSVLAFTSRGAATDQACRMFLHQLVLVRAQVSEAVEDANETPPASVETRRSAANADAVLYWLDRSLDSFASGSGCEGHWGPEEQRAARSVIVAQDRATGLIAPFAPVADFFRRDGLAQLAGIVDETAGHGASALKDIRQEESDAEDQLRALAASLAPRIAALWPEEHPNGQ